MTDAYRIDLPIYGLESDERHDGVILLSHDAAEKTTALAMPNGWLVRDWELVGNEPGWMCVFSYVISAKSVAKLYKVRPRCDGNHGGPECADPECLARD